MLSSKSKIRASFATNANTVTRDPVPILHAPAQQTVSETKLKSTLSADQSAVGTGDSRSVHDLSMDTEKCEYSDDDDTEKRDPNHTSVRLPAEPGSPADQYSQAMKHLESLQDRGNTLSALTPHPLLVFSTSLQIL